MIRRVSRLRALGRRPGGAARPRPTKILDDLRHARAAHRDRARPTTGSTAGAWQALADAGLLGIGLPEAYGGGGARLPRDLRRARGDRPRPSRRSRSCRRIVGRARRSPSSATTTQRSRWLPEAAGGDAVLDARARRSPTTTTRRRRRPRADVGRDGWRLVGAKHCVPAAHLAAPHARAGAHRRRRSACSSSTRKADGVTLTRAVATNGEPRLPRRPRRRVGRTARRPGRRHRASSRGPSQHALAALCVDPGRGERARAADDGRVHVDARAVRSSHRGVPGRLAAGRRRLHRHRGDPAHRVAGGVARRRGAPRGRRGRDRQVLGRRRGPAGRARSPAPARRSRRSTSTIRCTATSSGRSRSSSRSARPPASSSASAAPSPAPDQDALPQPVGRRGGRGRRAVRAARRARAACGGGGDAKSAPPTDRRHDHDAPRADHDDRCRPTGAGSRRPRSRRCRSTTSPVRRPRRGRSRTRGT